MPYQFAQTHLAGLLRLELHGHISVGDFQTLNDTVIDYIEHSSGSSYLLMDMSETESLPFYIEQVRASQTFPQHPRLKSIYIVSTNKLHRLAMLVLFSLAPARVHLCDSEVEALRLLQIRA